MESQPKIRQNLDTNFLKVVAVTSMFIDHIGKIFFPGNMAMAILGRIAFPLFAYCIVVGCLYTHNLKKYILRLGIFAILSQPFFNLAFHPTWQQFWEELLSVNIFFTLIAGVLAVTALMNVKKHWWMLLIALAMELFIGLDYGLYGIIMMVLFYLCRNKTWLSLPLVLAWMCTMMMGELVHIGTLGLDTQFFAVLSLPFIYIHTNFRPNIPKYFFYIFYPAHLLLIIVLRFTLHV